MEGGGGRRGEEKSGRGRREGGSAGGPESQKLATKNQLWRGHPGLMVHKRGH